MPSPTTRRAVLVSGAALLVPFPLAAQTTAPGEAAAFIDAVGNEALSLIAADRLSGSASVERFRALFNRIVDVPYVARFGLGRFWNAAVCCSKRRHKNQPMGFSMSALR